MKKNLFKISLIFATIGNDSIFKILNELSSSSFKNEILIVISLPPNASDFAIKLEDYFFKCYPSLNYEIIFSPLMGQVAQRAHAIRNTDSHIIIQMDDDLNISSNAFDGLIRDIEVLGPGHALGPKIYPYLGFDDFSTLKKILYKYIYSRCDSDLRKGGILYSGIALYPSIFNDNYTPVEWLPGGCVCYYRCDALFDNYYPFLGKAYYEDVIASILRSKMGIVHLINNEKISIDPPVEIYLFSQLLSNIKARNYMNILLGRNFIVNISNVIDLLYFILRKIKKIKIFN